MGNHNSGRRPSPTALTVLRGNPSKKRLNALEPHPPSGPAVKPADLSPGGAAVWDELAPICVAMGTLTGADVRVFVTMCELQSTLQRASGIKDGVWLAGDQDNLIRVLRLERDTANSLRAYYALFGLEPVSRARVQVPKKDDAPVSKWAGILK